MDVTNPFRKVKKMKKYSYTLLVITALLATVLSGCGGALAAAETSTGSDKPLASLVEFTGVIEAMDGNQWTVNGQVITVDPATVKNGPFVVGDTVKIEAEVQTDGSVVVTRVELPGATNDNTNDDNSNTSLDNSNVNLNDNTNGSLGGGVNSNDNSNVNVNENSNDDNSNDSSLNSNDDDSQDDDSSNGNSNDDDSNDDHSGSGSEGNSNGDD